MGTLGDRIGRRKLLLSGAAAFGGASVLAGLSTSAEMLLVTRALLGITGATLVPSTLSLIRTMFHDHSPAPRAKIITRTPHEGLRTPENGRRPPDAGSRRPAWLYT